MIYYICIIIFSTGGDHMLGFGVTDVGRRRDVNQDSFIIDQLSPDVLLAVVCDGMGGAAGGLEASSIACSVFADSVEGDLDKCADGGIGLQANKAKRILQRGVVRANNAVMARAAEDPELEGMGTTLVAVLVLGDCVYAVNVGDSRLYLVSEERAEQITHDHSYVQFLVDIGKLSPEEARSSANKNIITRAVGTSRDTEADFFTVGAAPGSRLLLCSDGLTNMLSPDEIAKRFIGDTSDEETLAAVCRDLVDSANENGGNDNITAVIVSL